jgi:hypothetical protein
MENRCLERCLKWWSTTCLSTCEALIVQTPFKKNKEFKNGAQDGQIGLMGGVVPVERRGI